MKIDRFLPPRSTDEAIRLDVATQRGQADLPAYTSPDDRVRSWVAAKRGLSFVSHSPRPRSSPGPTGPATGAAMSLSEQARQRRAQERMGR